jgi:hypothetical protein
MDDRPQKTLIAHSLQSKAKSQADEILSVLFCKIKDKMEV